MKIAYTPDKMYHFYSKSNLKNHTVLHLISMLYFGPTSRGLDVFYIFTL